ncbi:MAG: GGDEF domain-containing protein [Eubacterium sp.]|nr:GGDEF domain-containing protein [Eubacterium sp.]
MYNKARANKKTRVLIEAYGSSLKTSTIALVVVCLLECIMITYTFTNPDLYQTYLFRYRCFYVFLLSFSLICIIINATVSRDIEHRYILLQIINPLCAIVLYGWSLAISLSDKIINGVVDPMVFMTFSFIVPLSFFMTPYVYALMVVLADTGMLYLIIDTYGMTPSLINVFVFFVFQIVLGMNFLYIRLTLAERIIDELDSADLDAMTLLLNRRVYEIDVTRFDKERGNREIVYVSMDINGLKEVNDTYGHDAGDNYIIGAAQCMKMCFSTKGKVYRIGGDEFVALIYANRKETEELLDSYDLRIADWSQDNSIFLSTSYGYVCSSEFPDSSVADLAKIADKRMYEAKARYYQLNGNERRK